MIFALNERIAVLLVIKKRHQLPLSIQSIIIIFNLYIFVYLHFTSQTLISISTNTTLYSVSQTLTRSDI